MDKELCPCTYYVRLFILLLNLDEHQLTGDLMTAPTISQACPTESYRYTESNKFKGLNKYKNTRFYHTESKEYTGSPYWELQVHLLYHTEGDIYTGLLFWFKSYTYNFFLPYRKLHVHRFTLQRATGTLGFTLSKDIYMAFWELQVKLFYHTKHAHGLTLQRVTGTIILSYHIHTRAYPTKHAHELTLLRSTFHTIPFWK